MKNWKFILRIVGISVAGIILLKMTYQFKFSSFIFDFIFFGILSIIGLIFFIWSLSVDLKQFLTLKKKIHLIPIGLGIIFTTIICVWNWKINSYFDKPTLLRIYYNGDINGTSIDFKTDGTYIFDNFAIGFSDYIHGTYEISENLITLDKMELDKVIKTNRLEIRPKTIKFPDRTESRPYLYQIDEEGNVLDNETEFRLVIDNRN